MADAHPGTDRLIPLKEAFPRVGMGRTRGYEELASGRLKAKKLGRRTYVAESEIRRYIDALPDATFTAAAE